MTLLIIYILIALGFSFLCSILEATLLTVTPAAVEAARSKGEGWATKMAELKNTTKPYHTTVFRCVASCNAVSLT